MVRPTKFCEVTVHLLTSETLNGRLHVDAGTSSAIRPSDALRDAPNQYLMLTHVTRGGQSLAEGGVVVIRASSIAFVEMAPGKWNT